MLSNITLEDDLTLVANDTVNASVEMGSGEMGSGSGETMLRLLNEDGSTPSISLCPHERRLGTSWVACPPCDFGVLREHLALHWRAPFGHFLGAQGREGRTQTQSRRCAG